MMTKPTTSGGESSSSVATAYATAAIVTWPTSAAPNARRSIPAKRSTERVNETLPIITARIAVENSVTTAIPGARSPVATAPSTQTSR